MEKENKMSISYYSRDFRSIREELIAYAKKAYPDTFQDFNDASVGTLLIELNAAVADMLSFAIANVPNDVFIDSNNRVLLYNLARTYGLKIPFKRPSITLVDFSVDVPVSGDTFDLTYAPLIIRGAQAVGGGIIFESLYDIDFSSPFSADGTPNRLIIPNFDNTGKVLSYTLTKREIVVSGKTKYYKRTIGVGDSKPYLSFYLPDNDIVSIDSIISLDGTSYNRLPTLSEQYNPDNLWYYVDSLAETEIFIEKPTQSTDNNSLMVGKWEEKTKKFTYEYSANGFCEIRFGGGVYDVSSYSSYVSDSTLLLDKINNMVNNLSTGEYPKANTTLFVKYKVGGGSRSNVGVNILTSVGDINIIVNGSNVATNSKVKNSLRVNNPIPALGGRDEFSNEELRNLIKYNFSSQNRCVTEKDYYLQVGKMGGKFGSPYRYSVAKNSGKVEISIIGLDANKKLSNSSTTTLKQNIAEYLSKYKMINDFVYVKDGKIINLGCEFTLLVDRLYNKAEVASNVINNIYNLLSTENMSMGQDILLGPIIEVVNNVGGVLNVVNYKFFNKVGNGYSQNMISQPYTDEDTKEIDLQSLNGIFANYDEIFEIKYKEKDIVIKFLNA